MLPDASDTLMLWLLKMLFPVALLPSPASDSPQCNWFLFSMEVKLAASSELLSLSSSLNGFSNSFTVPSDSSSSSISSRDGWASVNVVEVLEVLIFLWSI